MNRLKLGIIGFGRIAQEVHLNVLNALPGVEVVALAEPDPERGKQAQRKAPNAQVFADYEEMLSLPELVGVAICVPPLYHVQAAVAAIKAGKHIYLEKPLAMNLADAAPLMAAWQQSNVKASIGFNYRFNPLHLEARARLRSGEIGEVISVRMIFGEHGQALQPWLQKREQGGGVLLELASHHFDLLRYLLGKDVQEVSAKVLSLRTDDDYAALTLALADGTPVQSSYFFGPRQDDRIEIFGGKATLIIDRFRSLRVEIAGDRGAASRFTRLRHLAASALRSPLLGDDILAPTHEVSYDASLAHFVDSVRSDRMPSPDLADGYHSLAVVEAAKEAAKTGQSVAVKGYRNEDLVS